MRHRRRASDSISEHPLTVRVPGLRPEVASQPCRVQRHAPRRRCQKSLDRGDPRRVSSGSSAAPALARPRPPRARLSRCSLAEREALDHRQSPSFVERREHREQAMPVEPREFAVGEIVEDQDAVPRRAGLVRIRNRRSPTPQPDHADDDQRRQRRRRGVRRGGPSVVEDLVVLARLDRAHAQHEGRVASEACGVRTARLRHVEVGAEMHDVHGWLRRRRSPPSARGSRASTSREIATTRSATCATSTK